MNSFQDTHCERIWQVIDAEKSDAGHGSWYHSQNFARLDNGAFHIGNVASAAFSPVLPCGSDANIGARLAVRTDVATTPHDEPRGSQR